MPRAVNKAKIAVLDFGLDQTKMPHGVSYDIKDAEQVKLITKRCVLCPVAIFPHDTARKTFLKSAST